MVRCSEQHKNDDDVKKYSLFFPPFLFLLHFRPLLKNLQCLSSSLLFSTRSFSTFIPFLSTLMLFVFPLLFSPLLLHINHLFSPSFNPPYFYRPLLCCLQISKSYIPTRIQEAHASPKVRHD